ncbi:M20/M25/M40 family metallo-hydrolase [Flammeovirga sp. SubArs3]|uniref:M28 family metallopeptidase n=1 Tax=Flammeovirga sp. SubArs3 TaxID=2995316 RepID=UPI00248ABCD6|nr:M20/M25/M40 family metallo-hydrolase [Flammeovirga sp. SubArs3]
MRIVQTFSLVFAFFLVIQKSANAQISVARTQEIIDTLASDHLKGRYAGTEGEYITTEYIKDQFEKVGLKPAGENGTYFQTITKYYKSVQVEELFLNKILISKSDYFIDTNEKLVILKKAKGVKVVDLPEDQSFLNFREELIKSNELTLVWVKGDQHIQAMRNSKDKNTTGRYTDKLEADHTIIWVKENEKVKEKFKKMLLHYSQNVEEVKMRNVMAKIEGGAKPNEVVMISAHHDHIGILKPIQGDSIANGADDNASGVSAVIQLAEHYARRKMKYPRTILFTTFTAEEMGLVGSSYMADHMSEEELKSIVAMVNIEMIGKTSANGKRKAYITGYDKTNLGKIMAQTVLKNKMNFKFFPDPYDELHLFMRSDNAPFAAKGVPAQTVSSTDIDFDTYYHTVNDEIKTLNYQNIVDVIQGIAIGIEPVIKGRSTPTRVKQK